MFTGKELFSFHKWKKKVEVGTINSGKVNYSALAFRSIILEDQRRKFPGYFVLF